MTTNKAELPVKCSDPSCNGKLSIERDEANGVETGRCKRCKVITYMAGYVGDET
jgi:hypothetical protein